MSSKQQLKEAEEEAKNELLQIIKDAHNIREVLNFAKMELDAIEDELGKRSIPYGGGFVVGHGRRKRLKRQYFPGVPGDILDVKWRVYKDFVEGLKPLVEEIDECMRTFSYGEVKQMAIAEKIRPADGKIYMCKELIGKGWRVNGKRLVFE